MTYTKWRCKKCKYIGFAISGRHHEMNTCPCKQSGIDLEEYGCRIMGSYEHIEDIDYNFFDELLICLKEQGIFLEEKQVDLFGVPYKYIDSEPIRKLEDKMLKDLK
jgi:hypothetical protein